MFVFTIRTGTIDPAAIDQGPGPRQMSAATEHVPGQPAGNIGHVFIADARPYRRWLIATQIRRLGYAVTALDCNRLDEEQPHSLAPYDGPSCSLLVVASELPGASDIASRWSAAHVPVVMIDDGADGDPAMPEALEGVIRMQPPLTVSRWKTALRL